MKLRIYYTGHCYYPYEEMLKRFSKRPVSTDINLWSDYYEQFSKTHPSKTDIIVTI